MILHIFWLDFFRQGIDWQLFICRKVFEFEMKFFDFLTSNKIHDRLKMPKSAIVNVILLIFKLIF